ncbi:hypothetical protein [Mesorhizobium sp. B4-1-1]|uniref:hypothetical protein n=1 Tax=Mesorhizobium sp. B4-1-1 TaxID=2589890 RepID=UPI001128B6A0|nr:hypothetical protein [Mesorhizobium sp. B4-1-1]TPI18103.1 hypothetical protein FJW10_20080 [Mesorhizobium sp. B4-1-1]
MFGTGYHVFASDREAGMMGYGIAEPAELAILANALDTFCVKHGIAGEIEREQVALKIMCLFRRGVGDPGQLSAELESWAGNNRRAGWPARRALQPHADEADSCGTI